MGGRGEPAREVCYLRAVPWSVGSLIEKQLANRLLALRSRCFSFIINLTMRPSSPLPRVNDHLAAVVSWDFSLRWSSILQTINGRRLTQEILNEKALDEEKDNAAQKMNNKY